MTGDQFLPEIYKLELYMFLPREYIYMCVCVCATLDYKEFECGSLECISYNYALHVFQRLW